MLRSLGKRMSQIKSDPPRSSSISKRFSITLIANIVKGIATFISAILIARALSPAEYGTLIFLSTSFLVIVQFLDFGSSQAFFTFASSKEETRRFHNSFALWITIQYCVPALLILTLPLDDVLGLIWQSESRGRLLLAFSAIFAQYQLWIFVSNIAESQRLTWFTQISNILVSAIHLTAVAIFLYAEIATIELILCWTILEFAVATVLVLKTMPLRFSENSPEFSTSGIERYWSYCLPLIPYQAIGFAYAFLDTWLLRTFAGAVEQAHFGIALQFTSACLIVTTSILKIFGKEIAEAHSLGDNAKVEALLNQVIRLLYSLTSAAACLAPFVISSLIKYSVGEKYLDAANTVCLMLIYTLAQSATQIYSTLFYATSRLKEYVICSSLVLILGIALAFVLVGEITGLSSLGSEGLAIKLVVAGFTHLTVVGLLSKNLLSINYQWSYQIFIPAVFFSAAALSNLTAIQAGTNQLLTDILTVILFLTFCTVAVLWKPSFFGLPTLKRFTR